jgi:hypothetical protein
MKQEAHVAILMNSNRYLAIPLSAATALADMECLEEYWDEDEQRHKFRRTTMRPNMHIMPADDVAVMLVEERLNK